MFVSGQKTSIRPGDVDEDLKPAPRKRQKLKGRTVDRHKSRARCSLPVLLPTENQTLSTGPEPAFTLASETVRPMPVKTVISIRKSKLKNEVDRILAGENNDSPFSDLNQPLDSYYLKGRFYAFQTRCIPIEQVESWQKDIKQLSLTPDPVIKDLMARDNPDNIKVLQSRFLSEGIDNFACNEFHTTLDNILKCTQWNIRSFSGRIKRELEKFESDILTLQKLKQIPYKDFLALCIRFIIIQTAIGSCQTRVHDISGLKDEELDRAISVFNDLTYQKLYHERTPIGDRVSKVAQRPLSDLFGGGYISSLMRYIKDKPQYLMWFCFDELPYKFFPLASRYRIFPCGLQIAPLSYQNHGLMTGSDFSFHDFLHASYSFYWYGSPETQLEETQKTLTTIDDLCSEINLDPATTAALWFQLFLKVQENGDNLYRAKLLPPQCSTQIQHGQFWIPKDVERKHLVAAYEVMKFLFTEDAPTPDTSVL